MGGTNVKLRKFQRQPGSCGFGALVNAMERSNDQESKLGFLGKISGADNVEFV